MVRDSVRIRVGLGLWSVTCYGQIKVMLECMVIVMVMLELGLGFQFDHKKPY